MTTNLLSSQWNFSAPQNVYGLKYLKDTYNSESIASIGFSDDNELPTHRKKEILRSTNPKPPHKTRLPFLCVILKRASDYIRMLNIGSFSTGSESDGKITSLHTGHIFRSRRWGGRKFFSSIWGKLFIVLAIRFISSQNNGFLLGVRPRHLWHLLRVSPAKRRQVFGKTNRLANPNYVFITLSRGNNGIASKKKKKFILQYKCKRVANYSQIIKIVVAQRETCLIRTVHQLQTIKQHIKSKSREKKWTKQRKKKNTSFYFYVTKLSFSMGKHLCHFTKNSFMPRPCQKLFPSPDISKDVRWSVYTISKSVWKRIVTYVEL